MSAYENGYNRVFKTAGFEVSFKKKDPSLFSEGETQAGIGAVGIGAAGYGVSRAADAAHMRLSPYDSVLPGVTSKARNFQKLKYTSGDPLDFLAQYSDEASDLISKPVAGLPNGGSITGEHLVNKLRGGPLGKIMHAAGMTSEFTPKSVEHYRAFGTGPVSAVKQMYGESFDDLAGDFKTDILGKRYQAAQAALQDGAVHPSRFRQKLLELAENPEARAMLSRVDQQMLQADPDLYRSYLATVSKGQEASHIQDRLLQKIVDPRGLDKSTSNLVNDRLDRSLKGMGLTEESLMALDTPKRQRALKTMLRGGEDPLLDYARSKMTPQFMKNVGGYDPLINGIAKYDDTVKRTLRKLKHTGRAGKLLGVGALGVGALLAGKGMYDVSQKKPGYQFRINT